MATLPVIMPRYGCLAPRADTPARACYAGPRFTLSSSWVGKLIVPRAPTVPNPPEYGDVWTILARKWTIHAQ
jgi:hypothetical protein